MVCRPLPPWQFFIECKRVFSPAKVEVRIREAADQIRTELRHALPSTRDVVAVSLSPVMNPDAVAFRVANRPTGNQALER